MTKTYATVAGGRYDIPCVCFEPHGRIAEKVIIALHGFGGDKESSAVLRLAEAATDKNYAVICFDFPCHGASPVNEEYFTVDNCIADASRIYAFAKEKYFFDASGEGKIHFFATSFGAFVLANMLKNDEFAGSKAVFRAPAVMMHETFENVISNYTIAELAKDAVAECGFERKMRLGYGFYADLKDHALEDVFFSNPVLMIYGDRDNVVSPDHMGAFAGARSNIRSKVICGADHRFKNKGELDLVVKYSVDFFEE